MARARRSLTSRSTNPLGGMPLLTGNRALARRSLAARSPAAVLQTAARSSPARGLTAHRYRSLTARLALPSRSLAARSLLTQPLAQGPRSLCAPLARAVPARHLRSLPARWLSASRSLKPYWPLMLCWGKGPYRSLLARVLTTRCGAARSKSRQRDFRSLPAHLIGCYTAPLAQHAASAAFARRLLIW